MSKRLSFSQLENFNNCPYQWYVQYKLKMWSPKNIFMLFGIAMHQLLEQVYKDEIFEAEVYTERWKRVFRKEYLSGRYSSFDKGALNWQLSRGYPMIDNFFKVAKKKNLLKPAIETEKKLIGVFGKYIVVGILDLIHILDGKLTVMDYKTGKNEYDSHKLQLTLYKELANIKRKKDKIEQCAVWYLPSNKIKIIKPVRKETALYIKNTIKDMERMIKEDKFEKRKTKYCKDCIANIKGKCKRNERIA